MAKLEYLKVNIDLAKKAGPDGAMLYCYLRYVSRRKKSDDRGYFALDSAYIEKGLGFDRYRLARVRNKLVELRLIDYLAGRNQNRKPRYRIL